MGVADPLLVDNYDHFPGSKKSQVEIMLQRLRMLKSSLTACTYWDKVKNPSFIPAG